MSEQTLKTCVVCQIAKERTIAHYHRDSTSADGWRPDCKPCRALRRNEASKPAAKQLKRLDRTIKKAQAVLDDNQSSHTARVAADRTIRLAPKRRDALLKPLIKQREEAQRVKQLAEAGPSLARVHALGSALFGANGSLLDVAERPAQLAKFKAVLPTLTESADAAARDYVQSNIERLEPMVSEDAERAAFLAEQNQETINGTACQRAADAIRSKFAGLWSEHISPVDRAALKERFKQFRASAQKLHATVKKGDVDSTGADMKMKMSRILQELHEITKRLGAEETAIGPNTTLGNLQDFEWQQVTSGYQMRDYVRQLQNKLEAERATLTPKEFETKYLNLPAAPKEEAPVVWVVLDGKREIWYWPHGALVKKSEEVTYDFRLKAWCLMPGPVSIETDDEDKPAKMEWVQLDDGSWSKQIVDPDERWEQHDDATWHKVSGSSLWEKPVRIQFKKAPAQPDAEHSEFRSGHWWTKAECEKAESGPTLDKPPLILPPLARTVADSIAVEPVRPNPKDSIEPSVWKRHEQREQERKAREAELLRS